MNIITQEAPDRPALLMGNEAIARGALEAGIGVACAYPGTPSSEVIATLAKAAEERKLYVEWSINEKVAVEVAAAAALSGVRAMTAMKQNGLNVALDFLANLAVTGGLSKGLVLMVGDDPGGASSTNEQDSRHIAKILDLPLLEPATFQEAKDMTRWAFELSEVIGNVCLVRSVTRISHARGNVRLGALPHINNQAYFDTSMALAAIGGQSPRLHQILHDNLRKVADLYDDSSFNSYWGSKKPELLIITCGSGWLYSMEAVRIISSRRSIGILKLGTTWPLPPRFLRKHLAGAEKILVVEEVDAFLEANLKEFAIDRMAGGNYQFFGKASGHLKPYGEINVDSVIDAISGILSLDYQAREDAYEEKSWEAAALVPSRGSQLCPGCPHRATYWAIKDALKKVGGKGVVTGDIGCYAMGLTPTGFSQVKTVHAMGSGMGLAAGLGKLDLFSFKQPVLAMCGDSTFFHAVIPALLNAVHSEADVILVILDNSGTAMTGFQPHPGLDRDAAGQVRPGINLEKLCQALGVPVTVVDPYQLTATKKVFLEVLGQKGKTRVVISRRECALIRAGRQIGPIAKMRIESERCLGDDCGCDRYCTRVFKCPGLIWDREKKKAKIDEALCSGCGVCVEVCPQSAIKGEILS